MAAGAAAVAGGEVVGKGGLWRPGTGSALWLFFLSAEIDLYAIFALFYMKRTYCDRDVYVSHLFKE
jgi:hypothetical protein